jgi:hypothetical protein
MRSSQWEEARPAKFGRYLAIDTSSDVGPWCRLRWAGGARRACSGCVANVRHLPDLPMRRLIGTAPGEGQIEPRPFGRARGHKPTRNLALVAAIPPRSTGDEDCGPHVVADRVKGAHPNSRIATIRVVRPESVSDSTDWVCLPERGAEDRGVRAGAPTPVVRYSGHARTSSITTNELHHVILVSKRHQARARRGSRSEMTP